MTEQTTRRRFEMADRQELNRNLAQMLKGGVIMDVTTPEQAKIAEQAGAFAEMAAHCARWARRRSRHGSGLTSSTTSSSFIIWWTGLRRTSCANWRGLHLPANIRAKRSMARSSSSSDVFTRPSISATASPTARKSRFPSHLAPIGGCQATCVSISSDHFAPPYLFLRRAA